MEFKVTPRDKPMKKAYDKEYATSQFWVSAKYTK